ncbi:hypothetical protein OO17_10915, partial [Rhodopseudomonas palustris]
MQSPRIDRRFCRFLTGGAIALCVVALPGASQAAVDAALLPHNLSPWGMFVGADIVVRAVMVG